TSVIAYDRGPNPYQATFLRFNPGTGTWSSTGHTFNSETTANGGAKVNLIAGAVALPTGLYYFGGFFDVAKKFRLWSYNPATGQISLKGT
ncbi:hypothetical protein KCW65_26930, partial [Mycobacterium tuberculosis]|nr:hypothetical protein [Mycobacterium tuberculosis]